MDKNEIFNGMIQDAQETSRFIESKTAIITAIIGAILFYYLQDIEQIITNFANFSLLNYTFFSLVIILLIFNISILFKIVFPINNPKSKLPEYFSDFPNIYLTNYHLDSLNPKLEDYKNSIKSDLDLSKALELEYAKTSYIRNNKLYLFKILAIGTIVQVLITTINILIYKCELINLMVK